MNVLSKEEVKAMEEQLKKPFPAECIEWIPRKVKKTKDGFSMQVIPYISKTSIQNRLDEVFGMDGWSIRFREWKNIKTVDKNGTLVETQAQICTLSVRFGDVWIEKEDGAADSAIEPIKGGLTSSLKRAARTSCGIGRYLNDYPYTSITVDSMDTKYLTYAHKQLLASQYNIQYNMDNSNVGNKKNTNFNNANVQGNNNQNGNRENSKYNNQGARQATQQVQNNTSQQANTKPTQQANNKVEQAKVTSEQVEKPKSNGALDGMKNYIVNTCKMSNLDLVTILSEFNIFDVDDITFEIGSKVVSRINNQKKLQSQQGLAV